MTKFKVDFLPDYDENTILTELRRIAANTGKNSLSRKDIDVHGRVKSVTVIKKFGSLRKAHEAAGLVPIRFTKSTDDELIEIILDLWFQTQQDHGRRPFRTDLKSYSYPVSSDTICRRFGSWRRALICASEASDQAQREGEEQPRPESSEKSATKDSRTSISIRKRFFVGQRAGWSCQLCGATGREARFEVDHVVPVAKGGSDALSNLQLLCFACNRGKRDDLL